MYLPNTSPSHWGPNATYIPPARVGVVIGGNANFSIRIGVMQILAFLDTNMLVSPTRNCGDGGLSQCEDPTRMLLHRSGI